MDTNQRRFNDRMNRIERAASARVPRNSHIRPDGLVVPAPPARRRFRLPLKPILVVLSLSVMLKGFMIWQMGEPAFVARLDELAQGDRLDQVATYVLAVDPLSRSFADILNSFLGPAP